MDELDEKVNKAIADALKADREAREAAEKAAAETQAKIDAALKAQKEEFEAKLAESNRLPLGAAYVTKFSDIAKYDDLSAADTSFVIDTLKGAGKQVSQSAYKALVVKARNEKSSAAEAALKSARSAGIDMENVERAVKAATDPMYTGGSNIGSDWVGTAYSTQIWESVRAEAKVAAKIPSVTIPDGYSSQYFPLEYTDPTFYKVSEVTAADGTMKIPAGTVTASQMGTSTKQLSVGKLGARIMYSGELVEDSLIPVAAQLRMQLAQKGAETLDHVIIDGDNATDASTNINDIAGTPAGTEAFLLWDGMRQIALATSGQNRSAGGSLSDEDFLNTIKLLGTAGVGALDQTKCGFIIDAPTYWKAMTLPAVKTRDVNSNATIENGVLTRMYGYNVMPSYSMHYVSANRKANSAGKVDQDTAGNNLYGAILAVRWDGWKLGYKRRMTIETTRRPESDSWEIVALMRVGLAYRDTVSTAISYYVGV